MEVAERIKRLEKKIDSLIVKIEEPVTESEAAKFLGVTPKTLQDYHSAKKIPTSCYTINILGKRMYYKSKLICYTTSFNK